MGKLLAKSSRYFLGAAVLLQFIMPFIYPISGHDSFTHLNWLGQFTKLFRDGNMYPRWMPDSFWGYGAPAFYFYPPLTYWCASLISFFVPASPPALYHLLGFCISCASVITFYFYIRSFIGDKNAAWIGALVYGIFPYRLLDLYIRNSLSEHLAFVFLPLVFLGIEMALRCSTKKKIFITIIISAIGWAGLLLSNIPASIVVIYTVPIYSIIRVRETKLYKSLLSPLTGAIVGLMISAAYILPINHFTSAIKVFHFWDFLNSDSKTGIFIDFMSGNNRYFYVGLIITFCLIFWTLVQAYRIRKITVDRSLPLVLIVFFLIGIVMQIPFLFYSLLDIAPFFRLIQFSFRWDIVSVFASGVFVAMYYRIRENQSARIIITVTSAVTLIIGIGFYLSVQSEHWQYTGLPEHIDVAEYLPLSANNDFGIEKKELRSHANDDLIISSEGSGLHLLSVTAESIHFSFDSSLSPIPIIFHRMYFPTWKLKNINGVDIPLASDSLGRITALLPPSGGEYKLAIEKSSIENTGAAISFAGLSILVILLAVTTFWQNPKAS